MKEKFKNFTLNCTYEDLPEKLKGIDSQDWEILLVAPKNEKGPPWIVLGKRAQKTDQIQNSNLDIYRLEFPEVMEWERHFSNVRTTLVALLITVGSGALVTSLTKDGWLSLALFGGLCLVSSFGVNKIFSERTAEARLYSKILWKYFSGTTLEPPGGYIKSAWKSDAQMKKWYPPNETESTKESDLQGRSIYKAQIKRLKNRDKATFFLIFWVVATAFLGLLSWLHKINA